MKLIAAVSQSWGIGLDNELLYHLSEDMKFFRKTTKNKIVVMGRNTFESIGKPLPNRKLNIVLTSDTKFDVSKYDNPVFQVKTFNELLNALKTANPPEDIFCIGGAKLYETCLDYCDMAYITKIFDDKPANKFFPNLDKHPDWSLEWMTPVKEQDGIQFQMQIYKNNNTKSICTKN